MTQNDSNTALVVQPDPRTQNVLSPVRAVAGRLGPFHVLEFTATKVDFATETYAESGGRALLKPALMRVAAAAGLSVVQSGPAPGTVPTRDWLMWQVTMRMPLGDGEYIDRIGTYEWDASIIVDEARDKNGRPLPDKDKLRLRQFRTMLAESKAMNRAIRSLLAIKSKYNSEELQRPFVIPRVRFEPDLSDPRVMEVVKARGAIAAASLFGPQEAPALPEHVDEGEAAAALAAMPEVPADDVHECEDAGTPEVVDEYEEVTHPDVPDIGSFVLKTNGRSKFDDMTLDDIDAKHPDYWAYIYPKVRKAADADALGDWAAAYPAIVQFVEERYPQVARNYEEG